MAYPTDFYETLVAANGAAQAILSPPKGLLEAVYTQFSSNYTGGLGQTLKINVPTVSVSNATDETNGGLTGIAAADTSVSIAINHKYGSNRMIPIYEDTLSPEEIGSIYIAPVIEEVLQKLGAGVGANFTETVFSTNSVISGAGADVVQRADLGKAYGVLRTKGVPIEPNNSFLAVHPVVGGNMLAASEFNAEATVGIRAAELAQQQARVVDQFGFRFIEDSNLTVATGVYTCVAFHRYSYGLRIVTPTLKNNGRVDQTVVMATPSIPVVVESWYEPKDQARWIHAFVMCGHGGVRPEMGQVIKTS